MTPAGRPHKYPDLGAVERRVIYLPVKVWRFFERIGGGSAARGMIAMMRGKPEPSENVIDSTKQSE